MDLLQSQQTVGMSSIPSPQFTLEGFTRRLIREKLTESRRLYLEQRIKELQDEISNG